MPSVSRGSVIRRALGYCLLVAGALIVLTVLPLWLWLALLGVACVTFGWFTVTRWK